MSEFSIEILLINSFSNAIAVLCKNKTVLIDELKTDVKKMVASLTCKVVSPVPTY